MLNKQKMMLHRTERGGNERGGNDTEEQSSAMKIFGMSSFPAAAMASYSPDTNILKQQKIPDPSHCPQSTISSNYSLFDNSDQNKQETELTHGKFGTYMGAEVDGGDSSLNNKYASKYEKALVKQSQTELGAPSQSEEIKKIKPRIPFSRLEDFIPSNISLKLSDNKLSFLFKNVGLTILFGLLYYLAVIVMDHTHIQSFWMCMYFSLVTQTTLGYGWYLPEGTLYRIINTAQMLILWFMILTIVVL